MVSGARSLALSLILFYLIFQLVLASRSPKYSQDCKTQEQNEMTSDMMYSSVSERLVLTGLFLLHSPRCHVSNVFNSLDNDTTRLRPALFLSHAYTLWIGLCSFHTHSKPSGVFQQQATHTLKHTLETDSEVNKHINTHTRTPFSVSVKEHQTRKNSCSVKAPLALLSRPSVSPLCMII